MATHASPARLFPCASAATWIPAAAAAALALLAFAGPFAGAFYWAGFHYNEGWNVYHAATAAHHGILYAQPYGFTTVNYPVLSFYLAAGLHSAGVPFLFAGRWLALLGTILSCAAAGLIAKRLGATPAFACFAAWFALAAFCIAGRALVGMDDPQMLADGLCMAGLLVYVSGRPGWLRLGAVAALLVLGGNVKDDVVVFPIAILIHLAIRDRRAALRFLSAALPLLGFSLVVEFWVGGPYFLTNLLTPRRWSLLSAIGKLAHFGVPFALAFPIAAVWSVAALRQPRRSILAIVFWVALAVGMVWAGGDGVDQNAFFALLLAMAMISGLVLTWLFERPGRRASWAAAGLGLALLAPMLYGARNLALIGDVASLPGQQRQFFRDVAWLRAQPGPAMCESMILCYKAGKPFLWDPYNTARFVALGKLDPAPLLRRVRRGQIGVIQLIHPLRSNIYLFPRLRQAIEAEYREIGGGRAGMHVYVPRRITGLPLPQG